MACLLSCWRERELPVVHIRHDSAEPQSRLQPGQPGNAIKDEVAPLPGETLFSKNVNSAFIGTPLEQHLKDNGYATLVVVGLTTDHCVSTSVRMAANLGFDVTLVGDATATFERTTSSGTHFSGSRCTISTLPAWTMSSARPEIQSRYCRDSTEGLSGSVRSCYRQIAFCKRQTANGKRQTANGKRQIGECGMICRCPKKKRRSASCPGPTIPSYIMLDNDHRI